MFRWILKNELAGGPRPRNGKQRLGQVSKSAVDTWLRQARRLGIRSIICFLDERELRRYQTLPVGLVPYYRANGFIVEHIPAANHQKPPLSARDLRKTWEAYNRLHKPVLIHCSAGRSRTGAAVRYIKQRESPSADH